MLYRDKNNIERRDGKLYWKILLHQSYNLVKYEIDKVTQVKISITKFKSTMARLSQLKTRRYTIFIHHFLHLAFLNLFFSFFFLQTCIRVYIIRHVYIRKQSVM